MNPWTKIICEERKKKSVWVICRYTFSSTTQRDGTYLHIFLKADLRIAGLCPYALQQHDLGGASNLCLQNPPVRLLRAAWRLRTGNRVISPSDFERMFHLDLPTNCSVASWMWLCARDVLRETRDVPRCPRTPVAGSLRQGISMWCSPTTQLPEIKIIAMEWAPHALDTRVEIRDRGR